jgi:hypothetical protein
LGFGGLGEGEVVVVEGVEVGGEGAVVGAYLLTED